MTVTSLHTNALAGGLTPAPWSALPGGRTHVFGPPEQRPGTNRRRASGGTATTERASLTVTFEVTLTGDDRFTDAAEVLDALQQVTDRLGTAHLQVSPRPRPVPAPDEDNEPTRVYVLSDAREVRIGTRVVPFTRIEFDLLHFLASHPRQVFSRQQLLQKVWGFAHGGHRTVDVHIRRLRAKLDDREVATTVRGVGYRLAEGADIRVLRTAAA